MKRESEKSLAASTQSKPGVSEGIPLRDNSVSPGVYEHTLVINILLLLKALQLYSEIGNVLAGDPGSIQNTAIQAGIKNLISTIEICGNEMKRLPVPPPGAESINQQFYELGVDIRSLAEILNRLDMTAVGEGQQNVFQDLHERSAKIKVSYRLAIENFDRIYPGRLSQILQFIKQSTA